MYVWFDALTNYLTGVDFFDLNEDGLGDRKGLWPCDCHLIGKDIIWFHTVIWPCMLMSADIALPKCTFAHGFINDKEGKKMSKSIGNVIDPHDMLDKYNLDAFRWYLSKEAPFGGELSFSEDSLVAMYNADLNDTLGNLVHRATNLCQKYCEGVIPDVPLASPLPIDLEALRSNIASKMDHFELDQVASVAIAAFRDINKYLTETEPWKMKGDAMDGARKTCVRTTLECVYACAHFLAPFIPSAADAIFKKCGTDGVTLDKLRPELLHLAVGTKISVGEILFTKIVSDEELSAAANKVKKAADLAAAQLKKKEARAKQNLKDQENAKGDVAQDDNQDDFTKIEIKVGKITKVSI